jgi:hypothetical protein
MQTPAARCGPLRSGSDEYGCAGRQAASEGERDDEREARQAARRAGVGGGDLDDCLRALSPTTTVGIISRCHQSAVAWRAVPPSRRIVASSSRRSVAVIAARGDATQR